MESRLRGGSEIEATLIATMINVRIIQPVTNSVKGYILYTTN